MHSLENSNSGSRIQGHNKTDYEASEFAAMLRCIRRFQVPRRRKPLQQTVSNWLYPIGFSSIRVNHMCTVSAYPNFDRSGVQYHFYPEDDDRALTALVESTSMQQIFDTFTSIPKEDLSVRHSVQALAALFGVQKFMFTVGHLFDPSETSEFKNQLDYIKTLRDHPVFQEIVRHVSDHRSEADDEPLAVSLSCLKKLQIGMRTEPAQNIIGELLRRKTSLSLFAISRVFVCMSSESIYGFTIMSQFLPVLYSKVDTMSTDLDVWGVTGALRNCIKCSTPAIHCKYLERLNEVLNENSVVFEINTLCKIIGFLNEISFLHLEVPEKESTSETTISTHDLIRKVCNLLEPRVCEMAMLDALSLNRFVRLKREPANFFSALSKRVSELAEEDPTVSLMSVIQPKSLAEQKKLSQFMHDFLDKCTYFENVYFRVYQILKRIQFDPLLYHKYWSKMTELLVNQDSKSDVEGIFRDDFEDDTATDLTDEGLLISSGHFLKQNFFHIVSDYVHLRNQKIICAKLNNRRFNCNSQRCMIILDSTDEFWNNSFVPYEILKLMCSSGFYFPGALERVSKIICEFPNDVSVLFVERFLRACFMFGVEDIKGIEESARIISRNSHELYPFHLLSSFLALCFQGCLDRESVAKTFCPEFLDELDRNIAAMGYKSRKSWRLRNVFMELNRAVCLDMPEANVPWFHEKYCRDEAESRGYLRHTDLHSEVAQVLEDVLGNEYFARGTYSPYFYPIDFLIETNEFGHPVQIRSKSSQEKVEGARIAIIVNTSKDFTNYERKLKGRHVLMKRHLEIMGYRVVSIDPKQWNNFHMRNQSAKR
ncbi:unnamed protein product, partial [Allacma fusca]